MILELKYIAPYSPYNLKVQYIGILNGKELGDYNKKYELENKGIDLFDKDATPFNPPPIKTGLKIGYLKVIKAWKNGASYDVGIKSNGLKKMYGVNGDFKPILKPLSDLSKKINHNGLSFVPLEILLKMKYPKWDKENEGNNYGKITIDNEFRYAKAFYQNHCTNEISLDKRYLLNTDYATLTKLIEWHFDVFGLIGNNLAVSYADVKL